MARQFIEQVPTLPTDINLTNWNNSTYYFQTSWKIWRAPYSAVFPYGFTDETYFNSLANTAWTIMWPDIYDWVKSQGGWDLVDITFKQGIYKAVMMAIEFMRNNRAMEQIVTGSISIGDFNSSSSGFSLYNEKSLLGERCMAELTKMGILRVGIYNGWQRY